MLLMNYRLFVMMAENLQNMMTFSQSEDLLQILLFRMRMIQRFEDDDLGILDTVKTVKYKIHNTIYKTMIQ